jgi:hypothetical protein
MEPAERGLRHLHDDDLGFAPSCFVCEPRNDDEAMAWATIAIGGKFAVTVCAEATATFAILGEAHAVHATGAGPSEIDPTFLR